MFSYEPFKILLIKRKMKISDLRGTILSSPTIAKINKDKPVTLETLDKLCKYFHCRIEDLIVHIDDE